MHGIYGGEYDWLTSTRLFKWAKDRNLAVILPAGENSFYSDQAATHNYFGRFIGEELVQFTRTMFRLSDRREDTFVGGLSMGAMGAVSYTHLDVYKRQVLTRKRFWGNYRAVEMRLAQAAVKTRTWIENAMAQPHV